MDGFTNQGDSYRSICTSPWLAAGFHSDEIPCHMIWDFLIWSLGAQLLRPSIHRLAHVKNNIGIVHRLGWQQVNRGWKVVINVLETLRCLWRQQCRNFKISHIQPWMWTLVPSPPNMKYQMRVIGLSFVELHLEFVFNRSLVNSLFILKFKIIQGHGIGWQSSVIPIFGGEQWTCYSMVSKSYFNINIHILRRPWFKRSVPE